MIKDSTRQKGITILNLCKCNNIVSKYIEQSSFRTTRRSIQTYNKTDFNTTLTNRIRKQKISKDIEHCQSHESKLNLFQYTFTIYKNCTLRKIVENRKLNQTNKRGRTTKEIAGIKVFVEYFVCMCCCLFLIAF